MLALETLSAATSVENKIYELMFDIETLSGAQGMYLLSKLEENADTFDFELRDEFIKSVKSYIKNEIADEFVDMRNIVSVKSLPPLEDNPKLPKGVNRIAGVKEVKYGYSNFHTPSTSYVQQPTTLYVDWLGEVIKGVRYPVVRSYHSGPNCVEVSPSGWIESIPASYYETYKQEGNKITAVCSKYTAEKFKGVKWEISKSDNNLIEYFIELRLFMTKNMKKRATK